MSDVPTNGPNLYARLAYRMRESLGEFDNPDRDLEGLVRELAEFKRAHLTQPAQATLSTSLVREYADKLTAAHADRDAEVRELVEVCQDIEPWLAKHIVGGQLANRLRAALAKVTQDSSNGE